MNDEENEEMTITDLEIDVFEQIWILGVENIILGG